MCTAVYNSSYMMMYNFEASLMRTRRFREGEKPGKNEPKKTEKLSYPHSKLCMYNKILNHPMHRYILLFQAII